MRLEILSEEDWDKVVELYQIKAFQRLRWFLTSKHLLCATCSKTNDQLAELIEKLINEKY